MKRGQKRESVRTDTKDVTPTDGKNRNISFIQGILAFHLQGGIWTTGFPPDGQKGKRPINKWMGRDGHPRVVMATVQGEMRRVFDLLAKLKQWSLSPLYPQRLGVRTKEEKTQPGPGASVSSEGNPIKFIDDDLRGYMVPQRKTEKEVGTTVKRTGVIAIGPIMSVHRVDVVKHCGVRTLEAGRVAKSALSGKEKMAPAMIYEKEIVGEAFGTQPFTIELDNLGFFKEEEIRHLLGAADENGKRRRGRPAKNRHLDGAVEFRPFADERRWVLSKEERFRRLEAFLEALILPKIGALASSNYWPMAPIACLMVGMHQAVLLPQRLFRGELTEEGWLKGISLNVQAISQQLKDWGKYFTTPIYVAVDPQYSSDIKLPLDEINSSELNGSVKVAPSVAQAVRMLLENFEGGERLPWTNWKERDTPTTPIG